MFTGDYIDFTGLEQSRYKSCSRLLVYIVLKTPVCLPVSFIRAVPCLPETGGDHITAEAEIVCPGLFHRSGTLAIFSPGANAWKATDGGGALCDGLDAGLVPEEFHPSCHQTVDIPTDRSRCYVTLSYTASDRNSWCLSGRSSGFRLRCRRVEFALGCPTRAPLPERGASKLSLSPSRALGARRAGGTSSERNSWR